MQEAQLPVDERLREQALEELSILYTPAEERFDRITRMACRLFDVPISLFSLLHGDRQWFKSRQGIYTPETDRSISFSSHALLANKVFVIENADQDPRFRDSPLVTGKPGIKFYAGVAVCGPRGRKIGVLCIIDTAPRPFSVENCETLCDLAKWIESELKNVTLGQSQKKLIKRLDSARRKALIDPLTQIWNRKGIDRVILQECNRVRRELNGFGLMMMDLDRFKLVNDTYGHQTGDDILVRTVQRIRRSIRAYDALGRYGGEEFILVAPGCNAGETETIAEKIRRAIEASPVSTRSGKVKVTISIGVSEFTCQSEEDVQEAVSRADKALYQAKENGRNRVCSMH